VYSHRFLWFWCVFLHSAGSCVGTLCEVWTVGFRLFLAGVWCGVLHRAGTGVGTL
jgi:hypothetical protein